MHLDPDGPAFEQQLDVIELGERFAQDLLDDRLPDLLTGFGDQLVPGEVEPERAGEAGDLRAGGGRAEDHVTRPLDRDRRPGAQAIRKPPAAEQLHRARRGRLRPGSHRGHRGAGLDDYAANALMVQLGREGEADRATTDDDHWDDDWDDVAFGGAPTGGSGGHGLSTRQEERCPRECPPAGTRRLGRARGSP